MTVLEQLNSSAEPLLVQLCGLICSPVGALFIIFAAFLFGPTIIASIDITKGKKK